MSEALDEIKKDLDRRHEVAAELLAHMKNALAAYKVKGRENVNLPRCSREHLDYIVKELTTYVSDLHTARCNLPRLLENGSGLDDD